MIRSYRDLEVWQKSIELAEENHRLCNRMPRHEQFGLTSQMRRAAVSISSNIAEGHSSWKRRRFANHVAIARGSLAELETQIELATRFGYLNADDTERFSDLAVIVGRMLSNLRRSLDEPPKGGE
jgi:four helix bundle protein